MANAYFKGKGTNTDKIYFQNSIKLDFSKIYIHFRVRRLGGGGGVVGGEFGEKPNPEFKNCS